MEKKKWPYWLKGALIFGAVLLPIFISQKTAFAFLPFFLLWGFVSYALGVSFILKFAFLFVETQNGFPVDQKNWLIANFIAIVCYVIFGGLLGWLYGKLRSSWEKI